MYQRVDNVSLAGEQKPSASTPVLSPLDKVSMSRHKQLQCTTAVDIPGCACAVHYFSYYHMT